MKKWLDKQDTLRRIIYFFPFQLVLVVVKKNQGMILFWAILFGFITETLAPRYGAPFLFLSPEYFDKVNFWSYLIVGFACGGFIMAYNIANYVNNAFRFPFLATIANPFFKFCLNNYIIPVAFVLTYIYHIYNFQIDNQFATRGQVAIEILGLLLGILIFIVVSTLYFNLVNKDIFKMFGIEDDEQPKMQKKKAHKATIVFLKKNMQWRNVQFSRKEERDWHIETYMSSFFKIKLARGFEHYEKDILIKVFKQNHSNAAIFQVVTIFSLFALGLFRDYSFFEIPAGASVFLLFTTVLMFTSAMHTWFRGWATTVFIMLMLTINFVYQYDIFNDGNRAYGLNYNTEKAAFNYENLKKLDTNKTNREEDFNNTIQILNKWRLKNSQNSIEKFRKPKLVIVNTSGGGLRSTMWTFHSLRFADSLLKGQLLPHIQLIAGSSGGMIGAAYLRELYLLQLQHKIGSYYGDQYVDNIAKDMLNPIAFSIATTDLFFRLQSFKDGDNSYIMDRAYSFENKLNENTNNVMNKRLRDYREPEAEALIPMMIFAPVIINDSRKLIISSQPVSYITQNNISDNVLVKPLVENIEFRRFFEKQNADNLKFTTALRLNSTFPYILPIASLPSEPAMEIIDAGMRDNYGAEMAFLFLHAFKNWISSNTSGVVIIQIRDHHKEFPIEDNPPKSFMETATQPLGSFYGNLFYMQDFSQNQLILYASTWFPGKIDFIDFQLKNEVPDKISMSWHLTNKEKSKVLNSIYLPENQEAIKKLKTLLE